MKAKTFENLIRKIVREEIDYALRREIKSLKEDLRDDLKPTIIEQSKSSITDQIKNSLKQQPIPKKHFTKKPYVQNSTLNDLLNETAQGDTNLGSGNSPVSLSENFTIDTQNPINTTGLPDSVAKAVTRDYSDLMKAIDKKKGN